MTEPVTSFMESPRPVPCDAASPVHGAAEYGLPEDALARCCRPAHGRSGHVGYLGTIRMTWDVLEASDD